MYLDLRKFAVALVVLAGLEPTARAQPNNRQLQQSLKDTAVHAAWIYNDAGAGFAEAKRTGKPLLVVFR